MDRDTTIGNEAPGTVKARYRVLSTVALLSGVSLGWLGLSYGQPRVSAWIDDSLGRVSAALSSAELKSFRARTRPERHFDEATWRALDRLKNPERMLWGAHDDSLPRDFEGILKLERSLGTRMRILQIYIGWGDAPQQEFPLRTLERIWTAGSVPLVTWEPWLSAFDPERHPSLRPPKERDDRGLNDIASGKYDFYLRQWADSARAFGRPFFVRFAHEMNDGHRYPWGPSHNPESHDFVAAWRHVVSLFRDRGAHNALFVWAPSISYSGFEQFYPGTEWVDWIGTGVLNYGNAARWSKWQSMNELLEEHYPRLTQWALPVMIAEFGSVAGGGDRRHWYEDALNQLAYRYSGVKAVLFFNVHGDLTTTGEPLDWSVATSNVAGAIEKNLRAWF